MKKKFELSNIAFQTAASVVASGLSQIIPELIPETVGADGNHIATTVADTTINSVLNHAITGAPIDIGRIATNIAGNIAGKKLGETAISLTSPPKPNFERTEVSQQNKKDGRKFADQKHFLSSADIDIGKVLSSTCFLPDRLDNNSPITADIPIEAEKTGSLPGFETLDKVTNAMTHPKPLFPSEWRVGTRAMGGLQAVGGIVESGIGAACLRLGGANPAGILFCGSVIASGSDNVVTGAKTMVTGEHQETNFVRGAQKLGVDASGASLAQTALDLAVATSPMGLLKGSRLFSFFKPVKGGMGPTAKELAEQIAQSTGQEVKLLSNKGYKVEIPYGTRRIVVRVMDEAGGRRNYYRISIDGKQSFTKFGEASTDRSLTHIGIEATSHEDLLKVIQRITNEHTPKNKL